MRVLLVIVAFLAAQRGGAAPMGPDDARHLLNRTGFGATQSEVQTFAVLSYEEALDRLLVPRPLTTATKAPEWVIGRPERRRIRQLSEDERKDIRQQWVAQILELRGWWLAEMLATSSPLAERMTLFWHNHFVSSQQKVKLPVLMYRQNVTFRKHALGRFSDLVRAASKEPAMILYLDGVNNRKEQPNENFAREVMELFTLGEGHYGERDVKEAARAFTGWSVDRDTGEFIVRPRAHDDGVKTVLGRMGHFNGDDVLNILLAQPATAEHIVDKLWREFVSPQPDVGEVRRIAARFRGSDYEIKVALRELLNSRAFRAPQNRAMLIKSPIDLIVGTLHTFEVETGDLQPFAQLAAGLGQNLFAPPNVKGWPGQEDWINSTSLLGRKQFLERLFRGREMSSRREMTNGQADAKPGPQGRQPMMHAMMASHFDAQEWLDSRNEAQPAAIEKLLLPGEPVAQIGERVHGPEWLRALTQDPMYQLK